MKWYVVQTKPRQEFRAKENLENQGYVVYLPQCFMQRIKASRVIEELQVLFSRYLFIQLDEVTSHWAPIRSTRGVHQLLRFGKSAMPVSVPDQLVEQLQQEPLALKKSLFNPNDAVLIQDGPFRGLEGVFQKLQETDSGEMRVIILLEFLGKEREIALAPNQIISS